MKHLLFLALFWFFWWPICWLLPSKWYFENPDGCWGARFWIWMHAVAFDIHCKGVGVDYTSRDWYDSSQA